MTASITNRIIEKYFPGQDFLKILYFQRLKRWEGGLHVKKTTERENTLHAQEAVRLWGGEQFPVSKNYEHSEKGGVLRGQPTQCLLSVVRIIIRQWEGFKG